MKITERDLRIIYIYVESRPTINDEIAKMGEFYKVVDNNQILLQI